MIKAASLLLIALALPAWSCATQQLPTAPTGVPSDAVTVQFEPISDVSRSMVGGPQEPSYFVVRDQQDWVAFWSALTAAILPAPVAPVVDFDRDMVLVAGMGRRTTGGHAVSIEGVYTSEGVLYVDVLERSPGIGCLSSQVITAPVTAVRLQAYTGSVEFVRREERSSCG